MNANEIRQKYIGLQTKLKKSAEEIKLFGDYSCLFLCLCSIAEEYNESHHNQRRVDILADYIACRSKGWIGDEFFVKDSPAILSYLTGAKWERKMSEKLPDTIPENMYTVERWYNSKTKFTHFRRRWGDTIVDSNTVRNGKLTQYYLFTADYAVRG